MFSVNEEEKKRYNEQENSRAVQSAVLKSEFSIIGKKLTVPLCLLFFGLNVLFNSHLMSQLSFELISNQIIILSYVALIKKAIIYYKYGKFGPIDKDNTYSKNLYESTKSIYLKIGVTMLIILILILLEAIYLKYGGGLFGTN